MDPSHHVKLFARLWWWVIPFAIMSFVLSLPAVKRSLDKLGDRLVKPPEAIGYTDGELPVCLRAQRPIKFLYWLFFVPIGVILLGLSAYVLIGHDPQKIFGFILLCVVGSAILLVSASAITTQVQLMPTTIQYRNCLRNKTLAISDIVKMKKQATGNGWALSIRSRDAHIRFSYLAFSQAQILNIEKFLNDRVALSSRTDTLATQYKR